MNVMKQVNKVVFCFVKYNHIGDKYYNKVIRNINDEDIVLLQINYIISRRLDVHNIYGSEAKEHISNLVQNWNRQIQNSSWKTDCPKRRV